MRAMAGNLKGSSPHTRGARRPDHDRDRPVGIIPAYAGSTAMYCPWPLGAQDHPRIRGEHPYLSGSRRRQSGSSPHTRGARFLSHPFSVSSRIIPAYAGSTRFWCRRRSRGWDHPRIRGEHTLRLL